MPNAQSPRPLLFALLLAGCSGVGAPAEAPAPTEHDRISMRRGPCFGACPMYTVTVWGDGRVQFTGDRFVEDTGDHSAVADPARVAALFAYADSIGFFALPQNITPANEAACGMSHTDDASADITIEWGSRDHAVSHYFGCAKAPPELRTFESRIDEVTGTSQWIGRR